MDTSDSGGEVSFSEESVIAAEEMEDVLITEVSQASTSSSVPQVVQKKINITGFFQRYPNSSTPSEFPSSLKSFNPSDVHRSRPRTHSVLKSRMSFQKLNTTNQF